MILVGTHARIAARAQSSFQNIREVLAKGCGDYSAQSSIKGKLCASYLRCQKGMKDQAAIQCLECPRLVNFVPKMQSILVRCLWSDDDRIDALMTLPSELVTVSPSTLVADADNVAREHGVRHLLIVEAGRLYGVLCRCDLVEEPEAGETVAERANHCPWTATPATTLAQAAQLMRDKKIGMLPVVANRQLVGVVTRGDLRRAGLPETLLGAEPCASCHGTSGVFAHPDFENVRICLDCLDNSHEHLDYAELGG